MKSHSLRIGMISPTLLSTWCLCKSWRSASCNPTRFSSIKRARLWSWSFRNWMSFVRPCCTNDDSTCIREIALQAINVIWVYLTIFKLMSYFIDRVGYIMNGSVLERWRHTGKRWRSKRAKIMQAIGPCHPFFTHNPCCFLSATSKWYHTQANRYLKCLNYHTLGHHLNLLCKQCREPAPNRLYI